MDHEADIRLVDSQAKSIGGDQERNLILSRSSLASLLEPTLSIGRDTEQPENPSAARNSASSHTALTVDA